MNNSSDFGEYGKISDNLSINQCIYHCFKYICKEDQKKFLKKFRKNAHDSDEIMHIFRELILGAYLGYSNHKIKYEFNINGQTPDWSVATNNSKSDCIIELVNFHIDKKTEKQIQAHWEKSQVFFFFRDQNKDNLDRLHQSILHKIQKYRKLASELKIPYIISLYIDFKITVDIDEVKKCIFEKGINLFKKYPEVSGLLYFRESKGKYIFKYLQNQHALNKVEIADGFFNQNRLYFCNVVVSL